MSSFSWLRMPWARRVDARDAVRSALAGAQGMSTKAAAQVIFEAGGNTVLPAAVQTAVRGAVEREASRWLLAAGLVGARARCWRTRPHAPLRPRRWASRVGKSPAPWASRPRRAQ